ncbi:hypothetical protein LJ739_17700 [Aestuariibacter halophilus]|uniref:NUDIX hydrolase n=1 Tax=Fluctibacter halophilus TaxID=226011 RepID=A0ABS8GCG4_9ALTE|nr:hypothetical protein [Aestuariibacter halophilus]MCC2618094.1 hypothetical protein [Aestuariibacter halophilus]
MPRCYIALVILLMSSAWAAPQKAFHRLLMFNQQGQLMVVKIKGTDFWVTPGLYSTDEDFSPSRLHTLAGEYGLTINAPVLHGEFVLQFTNDTPDSTRYFYRAVVQGGTTTLPEAISEVRWLSVEDALKTMTFPHINLLTAQIEQHPDSVWQARIKRYQHNGAYKADLVSDFVAIRPIERPE